jgi:hypothetical protein
MRPVTVAGCRNINETLDKYLTDLPVHLCFLLNRQDQTYCFLIMASS